jgi:hypothetical protein
MSNRYGKSGTRTGYTRGSQTNDDDFIQVRITPDAYHMLTTYMFLKYGRVKGRMPYIVSDLIIKAVTSEMPEIVELRKKYGSNIKTQEHVESKSVQPQNMASTPEQEKAEAPPQTSSTAKSGKSVYDRWLVRFAGVLDGIQNMSRMEREAKELKFLFYPVTKTKAVVIDRYWINRAIELGNSPKFKIGLGQAEEIAKNIIEGNKRGEELSLAERVGLALYMLNKDGYVIYSSSGWTLAIPDIALDTSRKEKPASQAPKPEAKETEEKEPEAKTEPKKEEPKPEDVCSEKKIPEPTDLDFVRVDGVVEQIAYRECVEKRGYHFCMVLPELGVVVNPKFESDLLEKVRSGQVKYARADIDNAVEEYAKNRAKPLGAEEKEKILLKVLLQEAKIAYVNGEWKVVEKPKTGKSEAKAEAKAGVKTGSMIDSFQAQGV